MSSGFHHTHHSNELSMLDNDDGSVSPDPQTLDRLTVQLEYFNHW